jgi:hypothetical protein
LAKRLSFRGCTWTAWRVMRTVIRHLQSQDESGCLGLSGLAIGKLIVYTSSTSTFAEKVLMNLICLHHYLCSKAGTTDRPTTHATSQSPTMGRGTAVRDVLPNILEAMELMRGAGVAIASVSWLDETHGPRLREITRSRSPEASTLNIALNPHLNPHRAHNGMFTRIHSQDY